MARPKRVPHVVGSGNTKIILILPDEYDQIGSTCGVSKLTGAPPADAHSSSVRDAISTGKAFHAIVTYTAGGKRKTVKIIMAQSNVAQVHALVGKTINSNEISTAYFKEHITLG